MHDRGFTLVEMLVAATLVSILMLSVYGVFTQAARAQKRLEAEAGTSRQARVLFDRIGRELRSFHLPAARQSKPFTGGKAERDLPFMEFPTTAATPQAGAQGTFSAVRYALQKAQQPEGGYELMRSEWPLFTADGAQPRPLRLATGVKSLELRFYDDAAGAWVEQWEQSRPSAPKMVELSLVLSSEGLEVPYRSVLEVTRIQ